MILTVEHTSGGRKCDACSQKQELSGSRLPYRKPLNIKTHRIDQSVSRIRLCGVCSNRLYTDLKLALGL